jgi:hypothetical protein
MMNWHRGGRVLDGEKHREHTMRQALGIIVRAGAAVIAGVGLGACQRGATESGRVDATGTATTTSAESGRSGAALLDTAVQPGGRERAEFVVEGAVIRWIKNQDLRMPRAHEPTAADWAVLNFTKPPEHTPAK